MGIQTGKPIKLLYQTYGPTCQQKSEQLRRAVYNVRQQTKDTSGKNALQTLNKKPQKQAGDSLRPILNN